jgi:hypothetical protein
LFRNFKFLFVANSVFPLECAALGFVAYICREKANLWRKKNEIKSQREADRNELGAPRE